MKPGSKTKRSGMIWWSAMKQEQILCHAPRRMRHVVLKPPGQGIEDCARYILHIHGGWNRKLLISLGHFAHLGLMKPRFPSSFTPVCACRRPAPLGEVTSLIDRFPPRRRVPTYALCGLTKVSPICGRQPQSPTPSFRRRATATLVLSLPTAAHRESLFAHPATG